MDDYVQEDYVDARLREKQAQCIHPSVRCSLCGLYEDKLKRQDGQKIAYLESLLSDLGINILDDPEYATISMSEVTGTDDMTDDEFDRYS